MRTKRGWIIFALLFMASCHHPKEAMMRASYQGMAIGQDKMQPGSRALKIHVPFVTAAGYASESPAGFAPFLKGQRMEPANSTAHKKIQTEQPRAKKNTPAQATIKAPSTKTRPYSDGLFLGLTGLLGLAAACGFISLIPRMKKISWFALTHRAATRWIIGALNLGIGIAAVFLGRCFFENGVTTSHLSTIALTGGVLGIGMLYPMRKVQKGIFRFSYFRQKLFSFLMVFTGVALLTQVGNFAAHNTAAYPTVSYLFRALPSEDAGQAAMTTESETPPQPGGMGTGAKVLLTMLAIVVFLAAISLVAALSCLLICDGQEAFGAILLIGGIAALAALLVISLRAILRKR